MAAISTLRAGIASALTDNSLYSVFSFPPATPIANSVIVAPANPYISPSNGWHASISDQDKERSIREREPEGYYPCDKAKVDTHRW